MILINSLQSEWLKTRRSAASWLCITGGFFLPLLFMIGALKNGDTLNNAAIHGNAWMGYARHLWQFMGILLLPIGIVLAASLIAQTEYRNNTWKQLHTTPQSYTVIFTAKFITIFLMTVKFFIFFNIGMWLSAVLPSLIFDGRLPDDPLPVDFLLRLNAKMFICCLPVIALQYLMSMLFRNFLVSIGIGMLAVVASLILIEAWEYAWISPYSYTALLVMGAKNGVLKVNIYLVATAYFAVFLLSSFVLYRTKKAKG